MTISHITDPNDPAMLARYAQAFRSPLLSDGSAFGTFATCMPLITGFTTFRRLLLDGIVLRRAPSKPQSLRLAPTVVEETIP